MPHRYHFRQADVFTDKPFGGNPLAVFTDARRFVIEQGIEMGRPSQIHVEVKTTVGSGASGEDIAGIRIGGQAVIVEEGEMFW